VAVRLTALLNLDRQEVMKKLLHSKKFCWIARRIPFELARQVEEANIEGFPGQEPKVYPNGELPVSWSVWSAWIPLAGRAGNQV